MKDSIALVVEIIKCQAQTLEKVDIQTDVELFGPFPASIGHSVADETGTSAMDLIGIAKVRTGPKFTSRPQGDFVLIKEMGGAGQQPGFV